MMPEFKYALHLPTQILSNKIQPKMTYASSKDALKRALNGIAAEVQANDQDDIEYNTILNKFAKGA